MSERKPRIGTLQLATLYELTPAEADPFGAHFQRAALEQSIAQRLDVYEEWLDRAGAAKLDLVVTTEDLTALAGAMTFLDDPGLFRDLVATWAPQAADRLAECARRHRMHVVACYYEPDGDRIFNVAVCFGRDGNVVGKYRKVHLPVYETWLVSAGDEFPVFTTDLGRLGLNVCYDQMWPEAAAACALNGAELIAIPSAASPPAFRLQARALDNLVFVVSSHAWHSLVVGPDGTILADAGTAAEALAWADVQVTGATRARDNYYEHLYSGIRDHKERHLKLRRQMAYAPLVAARPPLAGTYPAGGVANTPDEIQRVYALHKAEMQRLARGEPGRYDWRW